MPLPIQNPKASNLLTSFFGLVGRPSLSLDEIVVPIALVTDLEDPFSSGAVERRLAAGSSFMGATVGGNSSVQLLNPANSGVIVGVRRIFITLGTAGVIARVNFLDTALATAETAVDWRDRRITGQPVGLMFREAPAGAPGTSALIRAGTDGGGLLTIADPRYILGPGQGIVVTTATQNMDVTVTYFWEERQTTAAGS